MDAGLLPVKRLDRSKARLKSAYSDEGRGRIAAALLEDALALCDAASFLRWWVVSDDPGVLARAESLGLDVVTDDGGGLNAALMKSLRVVAEAGATSATIVPADVPLARAEDLLDLVDTGATSDVVVVPSADDGGTNALHLRPPDAIEPRFGPGSLAEHLEAARAGALRCSILALDRLALDIDTPEDAHEFLTRANRGRTYEVLRALREPG